MKRTYSKELILEKAILLSKEVGFQKLTMRNLAKRLGCSVMPIYDCFISKDVLLEEIYCTIIKEQTHVQGYFKRNEAILLQGINNPIFYRDMRMFGAKVYDFDLLYEDTISMMQSENRLTGFSERACKSLHFDLSVYITGMIERQLNKIYNIEDFETFCINTLRQFTEVLIMGYEQGILIEEGDHF